MRKTITLSFALIVSAALAGCTTTDGNANLRNANSNTGYVTSSPTPMATSTPISNTGNTGAMNSTNGSSNANHMSNTNSTHSNMTSNSNMKSNSNKTNTNH